MKNRANKADGRSWNLYTYVRNNPLRYTDPDGQAVQVCLNDENGKQQCVTMSDSDYDKSRRNNPGIVAPSAGGNAGLGGAITCGGKVCGSAYYQEEGMVDISGSVYAGVQLARAGITLGTALVQGIRQGVSKEAASSAAEVVASGSKAAIREAMESGAIKESQKAAVRRALARGKASDTFTVESASGGSIRVTREVAGYAGGRATYSQVIDASGQTVPGSVVQLGYDASGNLQHVDPKH